ncbi:[protein-PII] uridylyltransferase family protein [Alienimonas californiensis]|uniref:Bifunctional uridylyltransferase/uridylyl-removing enzyme n=1 Tax=Alienimonas californiensis TaxID=2527989 RepID=A0A517PET0_9PLAN|nr:HD domain-containing protein [Alienimonas californiensis]QDT17865.1 Bifunctional uridylyltransferase/uridylyl-removing enzyme [Alienimonas californiensis]
MTDPSAAPVSPAPGTPAAGDDDGPRGDAEALTRRAARRWSGRLTQAREARDAGAGGREVAALLSGLADECVRDLYEASLRGLPERDREPARRSTAVVATGGTGRGEMCPHSDVDVLLLGPAGVRGPRSTELHRAVVRGLVRASWDAGLPLAHASHTLHTALAAMRADIETATAYTEARLICGDPDRAARFVAAAHRWIRGRSVRFCRDVLAARQLERIAHGDTPFLLEPNLKRASGGLRDSHLLRWVAAAACGTTDPDELVRIDALTAADRDDWIAAVDALLDVRCGLHLAAGRGRDVFTRTDQLDLIPGPEERGADARRAVEEFMRNFLTRTGRLAELTDRFVSRHRPRRWQTRLKRALRRPVRGAEEQLTAGPNTLDLPEDRQPAVAADPARTLSIFGVAAQTGSLPSPNLADAIREAVPRWPAEVPPAVAAEFDALLAAGVHVGAAVRSLHRHGALGWLLPPMEQVRCLTQFNQYHTYTVDEHSLRCVEAACGMLLDPLPDAAEPFIESEVEGVAAWGGCDAAVSAARRAVQDAGLLTLAVLLHDCGKGAGRDHSVEGAERAWDVATRLGLSEERRDLLVWLVAHHLKMTHLVLRRDTADPATIFRFARDVGDVPRLRMLYVLSAADLRGVGPEAWTAWKGDLLANFYEDTRRVLDGGRPASHEHAEQRLQAAADAFARRETAAVDPARQTAERATVRAWAEYKLRQFSPHLVGLRELERLCDDLHELRNLPVRGAVADGVFDPQTGTTEYRLIAAAASVGLFARLAGALASRRLEVVDAVVESLEDGSVLDVFRVLDRDFQPPMPTPPPGLAPIAATAPTAVPDWRVKQVADALRDAALSELADDAAAAAASRARVPAAIAASRPFGAAAPLPAEVTGESVSVTADNDSSEACTVFDVFATDAPGLMFALATALAEQDLTVRLAKISTHLDQVVDVFYVTDAGGNKVTDPDRLEAMREFLLARVRAFEKDAK